MILAILILASSLFGCGVLNKIMPKAGDPTILNNLRVEYEKKLTTIDGWPSRTDCDALLWASVSKYAAVQNIDLTEARDSLGKWYRRPSKDCFDKGDSRSDISGDMVAGLALALDKKDIEKLIKFGKAVNWDMGRGDPGATILKPNLIAVLGRIVGQNLGPRYFYFRSDKDYVRHIQSLMIYVDARSTGFVTKDELDLLKSYDKEKDYLLKAIISKYTGRSEGAVNMLLNGIKPPSYVRGDQPERYALAHWLLAAKITLGE